MMEGVKKNILTKQDLEMGGLLRWAESEACRLSHLTTFKPHGWTAVGYTKALKGLKDQLRAVYNGAVPLALVNDIIDMARLKALSRE